MYFDRSIKVVWVGRFNLVPATTSVLLHITACYEVKELGPATRRSLNLGKESFVLKS